MTRRSFIPAAASALALTGAGGASGAERKGRLKQAVTRGVFGSQMSKDLEACCKMAAEFGVKGFDLIGPQDWPLLKKYGLLPTMVPGGTGIGEGTNRLENHAR